MNPTPMPETDLWDLINAAEARMTVPQARLWDAIRILPERWKQHPYGHLSGGFWAVGVIGRVVVWFNEIEDGFNRSRYSQYGRIDEYWCNQDKLELTMQYLLTAIETGYDPGGFSGPPRSGTFRGPA